MLVLLMIDMVHYINVMLEFLMIDMEHCHAGVSHD